MSGRFLAPTLSGGGACCQRFCFCEEGPSSLCCGRFAQPLVLSSGGESPGYGKQPLVHVSQGDVLRVTYLR